MKLISNFLRVFALCSLLLSCLLTAGYASENLTASRDSLIQLMNSASTPARRLELLTHLSDIGLILDDYTYTEKLWKQAAESGDQDAMFNSVRPLALRYLNLCRLDSADIWIENVRTHMQGKPREVVLQYLCMMRDIRDLTQRKELAQKLVADTSVALQAANPYPYMRRLYSLGAIAMMMESTNNKLRLKPWNTYLEEGLEISRTLPLEEAYIFRVQFLMGLGSQDLKYTLELMDVYKEFRQLPKVKKRVFLSHQVEIAAIARMLNHGEKIGRQQMDSYFNEFKRLLKLYPQDVVLPPNYYYYYVAERYYSYIKDYPKAIECCDSVIKNAPKYNMDNSYHYEARSKYLAQSGRWKEAYHALTDFVTINDSISAQDISDELTELQTQYDVSRLELEKANLISRQQKVYILLSTLFLIILAGWLLHVYHTLRITRRLKQNLETESMKAKESEKMKTLFMNSMSHEIRTPLNSIQGFSDIILSEEVEDDLKEEMRESISQGVTQLTSLMDDMLEISQLGCTNDMLPVSPVYVGQLCEECMMIETRKYRKPDTDYRIENRCDSKTFLTNREYLMKAICNLLANANKFTQQGSITLSCQEDTRLNKLIVSVADTGPGIPADKQELVFEAFTKIDEFTPGTGLGLYVCQEIMKHLKGRIYIDTSYRDGTRMVIELPAEVAFPPTN